MDIENNDMNFFNARERDVLLGLNDQLLSCTGRVQLQGRIFDGLMEFLNSSSCAYLEVDDDCERVIFQDDMSINTSNELHDAYVSDFHRIDPALMHLLSTPILDRYDTRVFRLSDICSYRELENTEYYNEFLRPIDIHHLLLMQFPFGEKRNRQGYFGLHRPEGDIPFSRDELLKAKYIAKMLYPYLEKEYLRDELAIRNDILEGITVRTSDIKIVFLNDEGNILYTNDKANKDIAINLKEVMNMIRHTELSNDQIDVSYKEQNFSVRKTTRPNGLSGYLVIISLTSDNHIEIDRLLNMGLTSREAEIARLVIIGSTNREIAGALSISVRTVDNHVHRIFEKCSVNSRTKLASLCFAGAA